jgi:lantibiotic biosynthesis protein
MAAKTNDTNIPLQLLDKIIVRSPVYPFNFNASTDEVARLLEDDFFLEAIYIASPGLYDECLKFKNGQLKTEKETTKVINSLYRYYTRMFSRSTPFGTFSTCDVAQWGDGNNATVKREFTRHTRLDMHFLQTMISVLTQITYVDEVLLFHANSSIYIRGVEIRYIEYTYFNHVRKYKISAVTKNDYILKVLDSAKHGLTRKELVAVVVAEGIPQADAESFIEELIKSQLLVSEFEVAITGKDDFAFQILNHLQNIYQRTGSWYIRSISEFFKGIVDELQALDSGKPNKVAAYKNIIAKLKQLQPIIDEGKTFHIDSYRKGPEPLTLRESLKPEIMELVEYFARLNEGMLMLTKNMEDFKAKFWERYEGRTMPLAEVLDTDLGIGYPINRKTTSAAMVDDIPLGQRMGDSTIQLNVIEKWLFDLLRTPEYKDCYSIEVDKLPLPAHFVKQRGINWRNIPQSFSVIFRLLNDAKQTLYFEGFFGASASSLLARFSYGNEQIKQVIEDIVAKEDELTENAIRAEIVHLPDDRVTNVIMHPPFRKYEIPYLATPTVDKDHCIELNDLYVRMENNEVILFSKSLNKRVLPCKTHMHNHGNNALPLYNFLADLQQQGANKSLNFFGPGLTQLFVFLPRFYFKQTIISPAMWNLTATILKPLTNDDEAKAMAAIDKVRKEYNIPDVVLHVDGDNDLLVDFRSTASVQIWLNLIKVRQSVMLKEFLFEENGQGDNFRHQFVASILYTEKKEYPSPLTEAALAEQTEIQRGFAIGSNWLYLKLYCGIGSVDLVLSKLISPLMKSFMQQGVIEKWFFIKYHDTDYHIRLRLLLKDAAATQAVLNAIYQTINQSQERLLIWKIQPDNYLREVERYGANSIEACESLFFIDSLVTADMVGLLQRNPNGKLAFLWGMKLVDDLLNGFQLTLQEKLDFSDLIRKGFQREFNADKNSNDAINAKYNAYKNEMATIMGNEEVSPLGKRMYGLLEQKIQAQATAISEIIKLRDDKRLLVNFTDLLSSLIHMALNRLITTKERMHEFLAYEFLVKYYRMLMFKGKKGE